MKLVLALAVGGLCALIAFPEAQDFVNPVSSGTSAASSPMIVARVVGVISAFIALFILNFMAGIMLNVVDAAYCCLAIDMDGARPHKPEIASAIQATVVKAQPVVVQNPGGYGGNNVQLGQVVVHPNGRHQGQMMAP